MMISGICFVAAFVVSVLEIRAYQKRKKINQGIAFVLGKNKTKINTNNFLEPVGIGVSSEVLNIYDIYEACEKHEHVLNTIEERYNNVMGDAEPIDWYEKIAELKASGTRSVDNYVSAYAGQAGENAAIEMFEASGKRATLFESRTHPNDDIRVFNSDGSYTDYSVKSYSDISDFKNIVREHPESERYVVNNELYEKLEGSGEIEEYSKKGIEILDSGFSNQSAREEAYNTFSDISNAGDLTDNITVIAIAFLGYKTVKNINELKKGKQSQYETGVNIGGDVVRIGTSGVSGILGSKIGATIGTGVLPGIGTLVGGGIGAIVGAFVGGKFVSMAVEKVKWGKIIKAIDVFGEMFERGKINLKTGIRETILEISRVEKNYRNEIQLKKKYFPELSGYSMCKVTVPAILTHIHSRKLASEIERIDKSGKIFEKKICSVCEEAAIRMSNGKEGQFAKIKRRLIGELIVANISTFMNTASLPNYLSEVVRNYRNQIKNAPNHPYKFKSPSEDVVRSIAYKSYLDIGEKVCVDVMQINPWMVLLIFGLIVLGIYVN